MSPGPRGGSATIQPGRIQGMRRFNKAATLLSLCASVALAGCMSNEDTDETMAEADEALAQQKGDVGMAGQAGGWAPLPGQPGQGAALPPTSELPIGGAGIPS